MDNEDLVNSIELLTNKLDGVGIEIYHLNAAINSLKDAVTRLARSNEDEL